MILKKIGPQGLMCPHPGAIYMYISEVTEWPPIGKIAAHSAYDMFHGIST